MPSRTWKLLSVLAGLLALAPATALAAPANDNFAAAQVVGPALPVSVPATNVGATAEVGEAPHYSSNQATRSVWFRWASPYSGTVVIDTCDRKGGLATNGFRNLAVYTGNSLAALTTIASTAGSDCLFRFTSVASTNYRIAVDFANAEGDFQFKLRQLTPPVNDNFASAQVVGPALPIAVPGTTVDSTGQANEPSVLGGVSYARSVWYRWTAGVTGQVRVDFCEITPVSGATNRGAIVTKDAALPVTVGNTVTSASGCKLTFQAVSGTTYRIGYGGSFYGEMDFTLKVFSAPPPANDNFAGAQVVGPALPIAIDGNNDFSSAQAGEPEHGGSGSPARSVWYRWTPATSGTVRVNACSPAFGGARLGVYTGLAVNALTNAIAPPGYSPYCHTDLDAIAGTTYRIAVAGSDSDSGAGPFTLRIQPLVRPANDDLANAVELSGPLPLSLRSTNVLASKEPGEPGHSEYMSALASVWFKWRAPAAGQVEIRACETELGTVVGVYGGNSIATLEAVGGEPIYCAAEGAGQGGGLRFQAVAGTEYLVAVDATQLGREGDFTLRIDGPNGIPALPSPSGAGGPAQAGSGQRQALAKCKGIKSRMKRARCVRQEQLRQGRRECAKVAAGTKRQRCLRLSKRRAGVAFCRNAHAKRKVANRCVARVQAAKR